MPYQSSDLILDTHYNGFASDINDVWGTGTGDYGYGQTGTLATVADGNTITATQWSTLLARISSSASHQGSSITAITSPVVSDPIAAFTALSGNITTIRTNRLNSAGVGTQVSATGTNNTDWTTSLTVTNTVTFDGGDEARWFFNAGGYIEVSVSHGAGNAKDTEWTDTCTQSGTYILRAQSGGKSGGSGTPTTNLTTTGYYDLLDASDTTMFQQAADTSPYTANFLRVSMQSNTDHADARGNNGNVVTVTVLLQDDAADTAFDKSVYSVQDNVTGTTTVTFSYFPPSTTYISNVWQTPVWGTATVTPSGAALT